MKGKNITEKYPLHAFIKDMYFYIEAYRKQFWAGTIIRVVDVTMQLYAGIALAGIINTIAGTNGRDYMYVVYIFLGWLLISLTRPYIQSVGKNVVFVLAEKARRDIELASLRTLFTHSSEWHEKENTGNKLKKITNGAEGVRTILFQWIKTYIEIFVTTVGMFVVVGLEDWILALFLAGFVIGYTFLSIQWLKPASKAARAVNEVDEQVNGVFFESANNIRTIQTLRLEKTITERAELFLQERFIRIKKRIIAFQLRNRNLHLFGGVFRICCLGFIAWGIMQGNYQVGFLALFYTYFNTLWIRAEQLADATQDFVVAKQQIARMRESFYDVPLTNPNETELFPKDWNKIEVADVSFSYGAEDVLKNISFEVKKGEKVGIVGLSGAGKSTLFKLLLKERVPTQGSVLVEGVPIDTIKNDSYLANVSVVLQDTEVFNMTLRENIEIVRGSTSHEGDLERSLEVSHVKDFVHKLPEGVETVIGEKGVKLSGGERQRLGIARAVYKNPEILLMDEATSHLDIESEKKIQASLHEFFQGVTAIVIAHRLTTIKEMDKILVIEEGRIVESGSFAELSKKKGRFYELWEKQQL